MRTDSLSPASATDGSQPTSVGLLDTLSVLKDNARLLALAPIGVGLAVLASTFLIQPTYTSTTTLLPPQQNQGAAAAILGSLGGLAGAAGGALPGLKNPADQWMGLLKSKTVADALVTQFKLKERYDVEYNFQARNTLADLTSITVGKDSLISIAVEDTDPKVAAQIANTYVQELQKLSKTIALTEATQRRIFFEGQLQEAKQNLVKAEVALQQGGVGESVLKASPEAAVGGIAEMKAQLAAAEVRVSLLRGTQTDDNPQLRMAMREVAALKTQLAQVSAAETGIKAGAGADYIARFREVKYYETLYELMAKQYELARADEARDGALIQVVDSADIPEWKSNPKRGLMAALGFLLALLITTLFVLIKESWRRTLASDDAAAIRLRRLTA